jgi:hypothetical protein
VNITVVTTDGDTFGGVFARGYRDAGGPPISSILILPPRPDLTFRGAERFVAGRKLLGIGGVFRLAFARKLHVPLTPNDRRLGLTSDWPMALADDQTRIERVPTLNNDRGAGALAVLAPHVLVSIGAPVVFDRSVLTIPTLGCVNVHNGRLPRYRGHFGTFWEVANGEEWSYTTIHEMAPSVDSGAILAASRVAVAACDSFLALMLAKKYAGGRLLADLLSRIGAASALVPGEIADGAGEGPTAYFRWPTPTQLGDFSWPR